MRKIFVFALLALLATVALPAAAQTDPQDPPPGDPSVWTTRVCSGDAAVVWQAEDESGDGVTLSALNSEGCTEDQQMAWFVIEPWGGSRLNADRACLAYSWEEVQQFVELSSLENGSAWRVDVDLENHPLVLPCLTADGEDFQLGLNPFESQLDVRRLRGTYRLLDELLADAGMDRADYLAVDEPLAQSLSALFAESQ